MRFMVLFLFMYTGTFLHAQDIVFLDSVPEKFKKQYKSEWHDYNPLHVEDYWQYASESGFRDRFVEKDTLINGTRYFKKVDFVFHGQHDRRRFYNWERIDTLRQATYMLDWEDIDEDGITTDELLLDSLEIPNYVEYTSYRFMWRGYTEFYFPKTAVIKDSAWVMVFGDTVIARLVEHLEHFSWQWVADGYGVIQFAQESPPMILTGAIIDSVEYGNVVSISDKPNYPPKQFIQLDNYPNPFNPATHIRFNLPGPMKITVAIYDVRGSLVQTLLSQHMKGGEHSLRFEGHNLASGVYVCVLKGGGYQVNSKMLLLK